MPGVRIKPWRILCISAWDRVVLKPRVYTWFQPSTGRTTGHADQNALLLGQGTPATVLISFTMGRVFTG